MVYIYPALLLEASWLNCPRANFDNAVDYPLGPVQGSGVMCSDNITTLRKYHGVDDAI